MHRGVYTDFLCKALPMPTEGPSDISEAAALLSELEKRNVKHVTVTQTGCIGMCQYEPIVEVFEPGKEKVTYVLMTPEKAVKVVNEHLVNSKPVAEYTVGAVTE